MGGGVVVGAGYGGSPWGGSLFPPIVVYRSITLKIVFLGVLEGWFRRQQLQKNKITTTTKKETTIMRTTMKKIITKTTKT